MNRNDIRKMQIQAYKAQLALTAALTQAYHADMENDEKGNACGDASRILSEMRNAGYAPRSFGVDALETGDETPEQIAEYMDALDY
jgi:hypothetical protein